ncbi:MAG: FecR family protein [Mucilaginibacter sp.]|nr:FecR family protein [Mucilaginibacter sp.]
MEKHNGGDLLKRYNEGTATPREIAIVESWLLDFPLGNREALDETETQADLAEIRRNLIVISSTPVVRPLWYKVAAAAVILISLSIGIYFYANKDAELTVAELIHHDIKPGKNAATLTLSNGLKITLDGSSKGKLAEQAGVTVEKDTAGHILYRTDLSATSKPSNNLVNTLSTTNGEQFRVDLPDGTKVWLNAASSLKYAPSFAGMKERKVELTGEAYFEVAKDKTHPFIVKTQSQEVKVLGTHFNINSYSDESNVKTTLLEGSVIVNDKAVLKPGQESILSATGELHVQEADLDVAIAWQKGEFKFKDVPLPIIMRQISRWYNLDVVYKGAVNNDTYNGVIDRKANLSRILKILERGGVRFRVQGKKLIVTP